MTICIAAICEDSIIIGASDRMITSGNGLFKSTPNRKKSFMANFKINDAVTIMKAGNMELQAQILERTGQILSELQEPSQLKVKKVVDAYIESYQEVYWQRAESEVLVPNFLNLEKFKQLQQQNFDSEAMKSIREKLEEFYESFRNSLDYETEAIIAGFDSEGAHLYRLERDKLTVATETGYTAIGIGAYHADTHFQLSHYTSNYSYGDAILTLYEAKKRAELAEGVGFQTDMFRLYPLPIRVGFPTFMRLGDFTTAMIDVVYEEMHKEILLISQKFKGKLRNELQESEIEYVKESYQNWKSSKANSEGYGNTDKTNVRDDTNES